MYHFKKRPDIKNSSPSKDFFLASNGPARDPNLDLASLGLLYKLLSNKPGWITHISSVQNTTQDGRDSIKARFKTLDETGYAIRFMYVDKASHTMKESVLHYSDTPGVFEIDEEELQYLEDNNLYLRPQLKSAWKDCEIIEVTNPLTANPLTARPTLIKLIVKNTKKIHSLLPIGNNSLEFSSLPAKPVEAKNSPKRQPIKIPNKLESNPTPPVQYNKVGSNGKQADSNKTVADHINILERRSTRQSIVESNNAQPEQKPEGNCPGPAPIALEDKDPRPPKSVRERMNGGESVNGSVRPKAEEPKIRAPRPVEDIMNHWFELGLSQIRSPRVWNSTVRTLKDLIKGKFIITNTRSNAFTTSEIKQAITNFARAALLPEYEPSNGYKDKLRTTSLTNFIYNPHAPNRKSLLLHYLNNEPVLVSESIPLPTPKDSRLYNTVVNVFADLSERTKESLAHIESKKLIEYADQLLPYWKKTFKRMSCFCTDPYGNFADVLKEAWQAAYPNHADLKAKAGSIRFFTDAWTIRHLTQYVQNITGTDGDEDDGCDFRAMAEQNANQLHSAQEEELGDYTEYF